MLPVEDQVLLQDTLVSLSVDDSVIEKIMSMLHDQETELTNNPLPKLQQTWFGGSYTGGVRLATNATQASTVVEIELANLVDGLRQYRESIKAFADDVRDTDESNALSMARIQNAANCVDGDTITTCAPPTEHS